MSSMSTLERLGPGASPRFVVGVGGCVAGLGVAVAANPLLAVPAAILAAFALITVVIPEAATLAVIGLLFANVPSVAINAHGAPVVFGVLVILLLLVPLGLYVARGEPLVTPLPFVLIVVLLLSAIASTINSQYQDVAFDKLQTFIFEGVLVYFLVSNVVRDPETLRRSLWVILGAGTFLGLVTLAQATSGDYFKPFGGFASVDPGFLSGKSEEARASGPVGDPNYFAQILLVALAIGLVFSWRGRTVVQRVAAGLATACVAYAIVLTYSRGAGVALFAVLIVMGSLRYFKAWQTATIVLGVVVLLAAVPQYGSKLTNLGSVTSATSQTGADPEADLSAQGRSTEMGAAALVFMDHPVLGVGPNVFPLYYQEYAKKVGGKIHDTALTGKDKGEVAQRESHNILLSYASELGIPGLIAFLGIIGVTLRDLRRTRKRCLAAGERESADLATALLLGIVGYLVASLFLTLAFERYFWLLLGLSGAATAVALRTSSRPGEPHAAAGG